MDPFCEVMLENVQQQKKAAQQAADLLVAGELLHNRAQVRSFGQ